jgi:drug/metabolite transporter (DMT)-like permease
MKPVWLLSLLLMNVLWAAAYSLFKVLAPVLDAGTLTTLRFGLATLLMVSLWRWLPGIAPRGFDLVRTIIMGVLVFCVAPRLQVSGVQMGNAGDAAILMAFDPVIVAIAAAAFLREHVSARSWAGFALGLAGVAVLAEFWRPDFRWPNLAANALILTSFVCESTYSIAGKPLIQRADPIKVLTCSLVAGSLVNLALNASSVAHAIPRLEPVHWLVLAYLVVFCTVVGYILWFLAVRETPVNLVASTVFVQPLAGVVFALMLVNEEPRWSQLGGALCIAMGLIVTLVGPKPRPVYATGLRANELDQS